MEDLNSPNISAPACNCFCVLFPSLCLALGVFHKIQQRDEFSYLFQLQPKISHWFRNDGYESLSEGKRIERKMEKQLYHQDNRTETARLKHLTSETISRLFMNEWMKLLTLHSLARKCEEKRFEREQNIVFLSTFASRKLNRSDHREKYDIKFETPSSSWKKNCWYVQYKLKN